MHPVAITYQWMFNININELYLGSVGTPLSTLCIVGCQNYTGIGIIGITVLIIIINSLPIDNESIRITNQICIFKHHSWFTRRYTSKNDTMKVLRTESSSQPNIGDQFWFSCQLLFQFTHSQSSAQIIIQTYKAIFSLFIIIFSKGVIKQCIYHEWRPV